MHVCHVPFRTRKKSFKMKVTQKLSQNTSLERDHVVKNTVLHLSLVPLRPLFLFCWRAAAIGSFFVVTLFSTPHLYVSPRLKHIRLCLILPFSFGVLLWMDAVSVYYCTFSESTFCAEG